MLLLFAILTESDLNWTGRCIANPITVTAQYQNGLVEFNTVISTLNADAQQQDLPASTQGSVATNLVQVYRALGGGWEIRDNRDPVELLPTDMKDEMRERTKAWQGVLE